MLSYCAVQLLCAQIVPLAQQDLSALLPRPGSERSSAAVEIKLALIENRIDAVMFQAGELVRAEPDNAEGFLWLGIAEIRRGNVHPAIRRLMRARQLDASAASAKALGVAYYLVRQHRLFEKMMQEAIRKDPADFGPYYFLGRFYDSDVSDFNRSADFFAKAIERNPNHFRSHYYLGHTLEARSEPKGAEIEYRRAIDLGKKTGIVSALPYLGLARLRTQVNQDEEALEYARQAVEAEPRDPSARKLFGKILATLGRNVEAVRESEIAVSLDPTDSSALYQLYRAYRQAGEAQKAETTLTKFRKLVSVYGTN